MGRDQLFFKKIKYSKTKLKNPNTLQVRLNMFVDILSHINFAVSLYLLKMNCLSPRYLAVILYNGNNIILRKETLKSIFMEDIEEGH